MEVVMQGLTFFNVQFGITGTWVVGHGEAVCGVKDLDNSGRVSI